MPELPEVETVRRDVEPVLVGRSIADVDVSHPHRHLVNLAAAVGRTCVQVTRRGKVIVADLAGEGPGEPLELVVHLGMTGRLLVKGPQDRRQDQSKDRSQGQSPERDAGVVAHERARLVLDDGVSLVFADARRFGRLMVCQPGQYPTLPMLASIGPDPDDMDPDRFVAALAATSRSVKACLLDQRMIAGVGNIYADEALHRAGLEPRTPASRIPADRARSLLSGLRDLLAVAVAAGGTTVRDYRHADGSLGGFQAQLQVYGRGGCRCLRCDGTLSQDTVAGRSTVWCRVCQPEPD
jgi:formamidopyrimidine-DNA glycosylase